MDLLNLIYMALVGGLGLLAIFILPSTRYLLSIRREDTSIPKNRLIGVLADSAVLINISAVVVSGIVAERYFDMFRGDPIEFNLVGVVLVFVLSAILTIPYRTANAMKSIGGDAVHIITPETQNQREDRQFGEQRRDLEQQHIDDAK